MKSFPKLRLLIFRMICGWRGVKRRISDSEFFVDESLRRWRFENEDETFEQIRRVVSAGDVVIDVGANFGLYSLPASRWVGSEGRVYAFEPLSGNVELLRRNISLNQIENIEIVRHAASNSKKEFIRFFSDSKDVSLTASLNIPESADFIEVPNVRIDDWCDSMGVVPDFIKIDVEGAEMEVLRGAEKVIRSRFPRLFIEVHGFALPNFGTNVEEVKGWLLGIGYVETRISGDDSYFSSLFEPSVEMFG